ncbi:MAG: prolipoprotein diacylglyceryl transferase [Clostridia bacterium]|nr:prolipoprotein diacylglyceryl transferase [Clostridia bacterium]
MYNDIVTIGSFTIHGYGLMIGIGFAVAVMLALFRAKKVNLNEDHVYNLSFVAIIFGFISAKLLYAIVDFKAVLQNPSLLVSGSGFVVYGGIIGGILAVMIYCRIKKIYFWEYFDLMIPSVAIAQGFGRIGCFLAGCCYGRETECAIGIAFTHSEYAPNGVKLLPTQLFSSAGMFLITAVLLIYAKKTKKSGTVGALYLILYSIGRFIIEIFRNDYRGNIGGVLSTSQFIACFTLVLGVALFCYRQKDGRQQEKGKNETYEN